MSLNQATILIPKYIIHYYSGIAEFYGIPRNAYLVIVLKKLIDEELIKVVMSHQEKSKTEHIKQAKLYAENFDAKNVQFIELDEKGKEKLITLRITFRTSTSFMKKIQDMVEENGVKFNKFIRQALAYEMANS